MSLADRVAIVGIGGIFSRSPALEHFWANVRDGMDTARDVPPGRWLLAPEHVYQPGNPAPDRVYSRRGCFVDDWQLDPEGLNVDRALLAQLDPLFHLALHAGRQAFQGAVTSRLDPMRVGVILGSIALPTETTSKLARDILGRTFEEKLVGAAPPPVEPVHPLNCFVTGLPAGIVAKALGLGGTCFTLDAACASSLYALKLAVDELLAGRADAMLTGGVSRPDSLYTQMGFSQLHALSPSGRCAPFDAAADGLVVGEGAGVLMLKRADDAVRDGDLIYATISGIGLSNDVQGKLLAPTTEGQLRAMRAAYQQAGWSPQDIELIECHGTGTAAGDGVELASLEALWGSDAWKPGQCVIGSVKSNIGHTLTAAGGAALLKVLFAFRHKVLPPTANFTRAAPGLKYQDSPFRVLGQPCEWRDNSCPRRAAVSAFGFGGINAHVLLEEWRPAFGTATKAFVSPAVPAAAPRSDATRRRQNIAIVGMDAHFGPWDSLRAFGERVLGSSQEQQPTPPTGWWGVEESDWFRREHPELAGLRGYFIGDFSIPLDKFRIPPKELEEMLPQQLLMLKVAAGAIADARWNSDQLLRTGVFVGVGLDLNTTNFCVRWSLLGQTPEVRDAAGPPLTANRTMGALASIAASRIAREFHIGGPSFTLSSAETSGLHGLNLAVGMLQRGELDQALVGAVDLAGDVRAVLGAGPDSDFVPGEGAAAIIVKRYDDAVRDGDRIYAVIEKVGAAGIDGPDNPETICADPSGVSARTGQAGSAAGLAEVVQTALCLHHRADGPRQLAVRCNSATGTAVQVVLTADQRSAASGQVAQRRQPLGSWRLTPAERSLRVQVGGSAFHVPTPPAPPAVVEATVPDVCPAIRDDTPALPLPTVVLEDGGALINAQPLLAQTSATGEAHALAHENYLRFSANLTDAYSQQLGRQMGLVEELQSGPSDGRDWAALPPATPEPATTPPVYLDRPQCVEFARGSIGRVLGPDYKAIDSFPTRVRLPDEPLMLVDRIVSVAGAQLSLTTGQVVTEHDVREGAWYLDCGRIPPCIAIEAGQADLFLSAYLGVDLRTRGLATYRLLDAAVTFHRALPQPDDVIRYDIRIERFFRQGDTHLFRFNFEGTVNGQPLLTMKDGCAGFFTAEELAAGRGIVQTELDRKSRPGKRPADWQELAPLARESYDERQVEALRRGDLAGSFGPGFGRIALKDPLRLPTDRMRLVHRVSQLDPTGGRYGLGSIRAEADIHPDDWFLTCHFVDDKVMPGTLMYECCLHTLRIFLMRLGWVGEQGEVVCEPVPGIASRLKCRGQVIENTKTAGYEVFIKELGYRPQPYALADAIMYADGKPIVEITDMSLQMSGLSLERLRSLWSPTGSARAAPSQRAPLFTRERILAFATGNPSDAFGAPYRPFDSERFIARLPAPPYSFLDRVTRIDAEPWEMKAGGVIESEYDVPADAWYFAAHRQPRMALAVLNEVALQACGFLAAYMGSALTSPHALHFRNLGGKAAQHRQVTPRTGTLTTTIKATRVSTSAGMIIQNYDFAVRARDDLVYQGDTYFGFFSRETLAQQVGIREAAPYAPTAAESRAARHFPYPQAAPFPDKQLRMIDHIDLYLLDAGPDKLGFIQGSKQVDPSEWFFKAHFYQDPVWPGSLGLESFVQLLQVFAVERWGSPPGQLFSTVGLGKPQRWLYRGQVLPSNREVSVQAVIKSIDDDRRLLQADGCLMVDGLAIYQMNDFTLALESGAR